MKTSEFDKIFDEGKEDILQYCDLESAERPNQKSKRVNIDFPAWMVHKLDQEAGKLGVTRQSLIKIWMADLIAERIQ